MRAADDGAARPGRLVWLATGLWKQQVKQGAEDDGLARARSWALESLLTAYAEGRVELPVTAAPVRSTAGVAA
ncbi:hypothetical protein [Streptomyces malaysiensis]|uniref:hypothetical protein n=1 Tax=Streptomyces malaysiensis TaxID=92644 RepID=UPI003722DE8C